MDTIKKLAPGISVSPQITTGGLAGLSRLGFRSIIINRPDGEGSDQPSFAEIKAAAATAGIETRHVPIVMDNLQDSDVHKFDQALHDLEAPVLAFCQTGKRAVILWSLAQIANGMPTEEALKTAKAAGFDVGEALSKHCGKGARVNKTDTSGPKA